MTEPKQSNAPLDTDESVEATAPLDPKEAMRLALERKKQNEHHSATHGINSDKGVGGRANSQMGGKRQFRRKSGG